MFRPFLFAAFVVISAGPVLANPEQPKLPRGTQVMRCTFETGHLSNSTPGEVDLLKIPGGEWKVYDTFLHHFDLPLQPVQVLVDNPKRTTFGWKVDRLKTKRNYYTPRVEFRVTRLKASGKASIAVRPRGYRSETAWGSCDPIHAIRAGAGGAASSS